MDNSEQNKTLWIELPELCQTENESLNQNKISWIEYPGRTMFQQVTFTIGDHSITYNNKDLFVLFEKYNQ